MRIHIIQPTHYTDPVSRRLFKTRKLSVVPLTLPYLAALIPKEVEVAIVDEKTRFFDFNRPCDCVFITVSTLNSLRTYEIAGGYRRKGVKVIMGGPHCYFHKEEVLEHADAVAVGEGEILIPEILADLSKGQLKRVYQTETLHDLNSLPLPRWDLLDFGTSKRFRAVAVQTSRGCPNACTFCAERFYLGKRYRLCPVDQVIEEIRSSKSRQILFVDSTFTGNRSRTMQLMERLIPLKIRWSALWTADRVVDSEFMTLAKRSGLLHINIGIESIKQETLDGMNKRTTKAESLTAVVKALRDMDISFSFNLIFGWDTDMKDDFPATLRFLEENKVHAAFFNPLSPHKGTRLYDEYLLQGRILDSDNLNRWPGISVQIQPKNLSPRELEEGIRTMYKNFYSWSSMLRRLPLPISMTSLATWIVNLSQRKMASGRAEDFDDY